MPVYWLIFLFALGLGVGSFINVLSLRYRLGEPVFKKDSLGGRSHCPACSTQLRWYELVPLISFIAQRGRCRTCGARISLQYPVVEFATGMLFVAIPLRLAALFSDPALLGGGVRFFDAALPLWLGFGALLVLIAAIDLRERVIPDELNIIIAGLGILYIIVQKIAGGFGFIEGSVVGYFAPMFAFRGDVFINHGVGMLFGLIFFGLIVLLSRGRAMGMGDVKLAAAAGLFLGWPDIALALALSFIVGSLGSILLILNKKKTLKDAVPFAPFIVAGILIAFFAGEEMMELYFSLFRF